MAGNIMIPKSSSNCLAIPQRILTTILDFTGRVAYTPAENFIIQFHIKAHPFIGKLIGFSTYFLMHACVALPCGLAILFDLELEQSPLPSWGKSR